MQSPQNVNDVQKLMGKITVLSHFISNLVDRSLPFFKILKKASYFQWDEQYEKPFQELKRISK